MATKKATKKAVKKAVAKKAVHRNLGNANPGTMSFIDKGGTSGGGFGAVARRKK